MNPFDPPAPDVPDFDAPDLVATVTGLPRETLDVLPFGVIRLDAEQRVTYFSRNEAKQSGFGDRPAVGLRFFTEVAPCMNAPAFRGRVAEAWERGTLDLAFDQVGDYDDPDRELRVRIVSAAGGGGWIFIDRR